VSRNRVEKRPQAIADLATIAIYLAEESGNDEVAFRFLDAAEASFDSLAATPEVGTVRRYNDTKLADVRMWRVAGFPNHLIFYRPVESGVEIIRVLHAKQDIEALFGDRG
jgi:toxin ParE1/3/4